MKIFALSLLMALVQGDTRCTNPEGNDGESYTEGCLKMTCKAGVWRSSSVTTLCCYNRQPYFPNTTITATKDGCLRAILYCEQEDDVATAILQVENNCGETSTVEQVQELKHLLVKHMEQTDCDKDSSASTSTTSTTTNPTDGKEGTPYNLNEDTVYEYENLPDNEKEVEYRVLSTPRILSTPENLLVNEGDTIRLPCKVDSLEGFVMLWKKNKNIITVGDQIIDKSVRLEKTSNGNSIVIGPATTEDEADYTCLISVFKPTEITHSVKIRIAPVIMISPEAVLVVTEGSPAHISCSVVSGSPTPQVTWRRRGRRMPSGEKEAVGNILHFPEVTRHHAGHYLCQADNGFGPTPVTEEIKLEVHYAPIVEKLDTELYTGLDLEEELVCNVHASPRAEVTWTKDGQTLKNNSPDLVFGQKGNKHSLNLKKISAGTFGKYTCEAKNDFGMDRISIEVSGKAEPAVFTSADISLYPDSYTLSWTAESKSDISTFLVQFKESRSSMWTSMEVTATKSSNRSWQGTARLSYLQSATQYQATVSSRNYFGFNKPKHVFNFATKS